MVKSNITYVRCNGKRNSGRLTDEEKSSHLFNSYIINAYRNWKCWQLAEQTLQYDFCLHSTKIANQTTNRTNKNKTNQKTACNQKEMFTNINEVRISVVWRPSTPNWKCWWTKMRTHQSQLLSVCLVNIWFHELTTYLTNSHGCNTDKSIGITLFLPEHLTIPPR